MINEDISQIRPEEVKTEDEGKGKLYASYAKEIDEHNILGKEQERKNFIAKGLIIALLLMVIGGVLSPFILISLGTYFFEHQLEKETNNSNIEYNVKGEVK